MSTRSIPEGEAVGDHLGSEAWTRMEDEGFVGLVGPFLSRRAPDRRTSYGFRAESRHANLLGTVQGGMLMTFADRALGLAAWEAGQQHPASTVHFSMNFVASAKIGSFIEIEPRVVRVTKSLIFMEGSLRSGETELAIAHGIWKKLSRVSGA